MTTEATWTRVDGYVEDRLIARDPAMDAVLAASVAAALPAINVTATQGRFLQLLMRMSGARSVLEVGTLGGYSTIWLARALPVGGRVVTLEIDPRHAAVAKANFARAGVDNVIDLRLGPAQQNLAALVTEAGEPFDLIFIDADKESSAEYFACALDLSRRGTVIVVDNVVRDGAVADAGSTDPRVLGVRRFIDQLAAESKVSATIIQTVGSKGYDGFALAVVL
jgi:predicted O-methyltransferase YrrM